MMGGLLALGTWVSAFVLVLMLGLPWVLALGRGRHLSLAVIRQSMWLGLAMWIVVILVLNLVTPLGSSAVLVVACALLAMSTVALITLRPTWRRERSRHPRAGWAVSVTSAAVVVYLALAAMGPVTNYDSGLYHLGAVRYASEFATIPGLGNLYQAFGYSNSQFPFAAAFTSGPWGAEGYRLANGFLITLLLVDLSIRWWERERGRGTYVILFGAVSVLIPMVALVDYWVTSPTSDSAVFVLIIVSAAYLVEALQRKSPWLPAAVAVMLAAVVVSMRPTMLAYGGGLVLVLAWRLVGRSRRPSRRGSGIMMLVGLLTAVLGVVQVTRDYVLTGWLMYPLSVLPFEVPWRTIDPVNTRLSTLGVARDPEAYQEALSGFGWVGGWFQRLPSAWETFQWLAMLAFFLVLLVLWRRVPPAQRQGRLLILAMTPFIVALAVWWLISPPSFRFAWGPLFGMLAVPIGWMAHDNAQAGRVRWLTPRVLLSAWSASVLGVLAFSTLFRVDWMSATEQRSFSLGPVSVEFRTTPVPVPATEDVPMPTGLLLKRPLPSDQCWAAYPLCTPLIETEVEFRAPGQGPSESIQGGFVHR